MTKIHQFKQNRFINLKGNLYDLNSPKIMGIINCTPDSFYSGSRKTHTIEILKTVESMLENGVDIIDIGGASTRPNALIPSVEEEIDRILEPIKAVRKEFKDLVLYKQVSKSVLKIRKHGFKVIVITNQPDYQRGLIKKK